MADITLRDTLYRDWPGLIASAVTFGLFTMAIYLVVLTQATVSDVKSEMHVLSHEVSEAKAQLSLVQNHLEKIERRGR